MSGWRSARLSPRVGLESHAEPVGFGEVGFDRLERNLVGVVARWGGLLRVRGPAVHPGEPEVAV